MTLQTISPSADRIGAALKALRRAQAQDGNSEDKLSLGAKCLHVLIAQLTEEGVPQEDLQPLVELEAVLQKAPRAAGQRHRQAPQGTPAERGAARPRERDDRSSDQGRQ